MAGLSSPLLRASALALGLGAVACGGDPIEVSRLLPEPEVAARLDFGDIPLGDVRVLELDIRNAGDGLLQVRRIVPDSDLVTSTHRFELELDGFEVAPGALRRIPVRFVPLAGEESEERSGLTLEWNLPEDGRVELVGAGVGSRIEVVPELVDFGPVLTGSDAELEVQVFNRHEVSAQLYVPLDGDNQPRVETTDGTGRFLQPTAVDPERGGAVGDRLEPGESETIRLRYVAGSADDGQRDQGRWLIASCAPSACRQTVALRGTPRADAFDCRPETLDFGAVNPGEVVTATASCTNVVNEPVRLGRVDLATGPEGFTVEVDESEGATLAPGRAFVLTATFSPIEGSTGDLVRDAEIAHRRATGTADLRPSRLALRGRVGRPQIVVTPDRLDFPPTALGTRTRRTLRVANPGPASLSVREVQVQGPFRIDEDSFTVAAESAVTVDVFYEPLLEGPVTGAVTLLSTDARTPSVSVPLRAESLLLPPCSYRVDGAADLGATWLGRPSATTFVVRNEGNADCLLADVRLTAASTLAWSLASDPSARLVAPGESTSIEVRFAPRAAGASEATLSWYMSDPSASEVVRTLTAQGVTDGLVIAPDPIVLPDPAGCDTVATEVRIHNPGSAPVTLAEVDVDGGHTLEGLPSPFPPNGRPLAAGESLTLTVRRDARVPAAPARLQVRDGGGATFVTPIAVAPTAARRIRFDPPAGPLHVLWVVSDGQPFEASFRAGFVNGALAVQASLEAAGVPTRMSVLRARAADLSCPQPRTAQRPPGTLQGACGYLADGSGTVFDATWRVVDSATAPSLALAFSALVDFGTTFTSAEHAGALAAAWQSPLRLGWNASLWRTEDPLAVVLVDSRDDGLPSDPRAVADLLRFFGGPHTTISAVAGPEVGFCNGGAGFAAQSPRLVGLARAGGGLPLQICATDWPARLVQGGLPVQGRRERFVLPESVTPGSVTVFADGVALSAEDVMPGVPRWRVDAGAVVFAPGFAPPGQVVEIEYTPTCGP